MLRLIYIINYVNIHFRWRCLGSVTCLCLLFVIGAFSSWMFVAREDACWRWGRWHHCRVEPACCKTVRLDAFVFCISNERWKRISLFKSRMSVWLEPPAAVTVPGTGLDPGQVTDPLWEISAWISHLNPAQDIPCAMLRSKLRYSDKQLCSHFYSSCQTLVAFYVKDAKPGSHGCRKWPQDYVITSSYHWDLKMCITCLFIKVQGLAFVHLFPKLCVLLQTNMQLLKGKKSCVSCVPSKLH